VSENRYSRNAWTGSKRDRCPNCPGQLGLEFPFRKARLFYRTLVPLSLIVTILSPTSTVQTPSVLLALAVVAEQPTLSNAMNSAEVEVAVL